MYASPDKRRLYSFTQHMQNWFLNLPVILLKWSDLLLPFSGILISPWIFSYPKCLPTYPLEAAALTNHVQQWNKIPEIFVALETTMFYNSYATDASVQGPFSFRFSLCCWSLCEFCHWLNGLWIKSLLLKLFCSDRQDSWQGRTVAPSGDFLFLFRLYSLQRLLP